MRRLVLITACVVAAAAQDDLLPKCSATVSQSFATNYSAQILLCANDLGNVSTSAVLTAPAFCSTSSCKALTTLSQSISNVCRPASDNLVPTQYCTAACKSTLTDMTSWRTNCNQSSASAVGYCVLCIKYRQNADNFVSTCGLWDSATAVRNDPSVNPTACANFGQGAVAPIPTASSGASTTWIIVGSIAGTIVFGGLAFIYLSRKTKKAGHSSSYRSPASGSSNSHHQSQHPRASRSGGSGLNSMRSNRFADMTMQNDIRFDAQLAQFRIPQQEIQNVSLLVKGGYGVVFHATFGKMDVAMKQLLPSKAKDTNAIQDFMNEIRLCARLEHPKIVKFVGISWSTLQDLAVLSEFMSNGDVTGLIRKERKKPEGQRLLHWLPTPHFGATKTSIAADVVDALVYLHSFQPTVIHR
ncbi:hypothetical protein As57867_019655, partial [Aphanomyces stellatus]